MLEALSGPPGIEVTGERAKAPKPSSTLSIAVTMPRPADGVGLTEFAGRMDGRAVQDFIPDPVAFDQALVEFERLGFSVTHRGRVSASVRGSKSLFERTFHTKLSVFSAEPSTAGQMSKPSFYFPGPDAGWKPRQSLSGLIDDAYIQWPHIYMSPNAVPPQVDYHHLRVPGDVSMLLNADAVHRLGVTGAGVRVAMIDSGFEFSHPYYLNRGYALSNVLAPGANRVDEDGNGHGTGEAANVLAVAPDVSLVGIKLDNETNPGLSASILEGLLEALTHNPDVITVSLGFDLVDELRKHLTFLPNNLKALEAEIQAAVADGTVIVFSAGNGHVAFPGMMPEVISAGGTFVDADSTLIASDYASAFPSQIYPGRNVPDFTGLVGLAANSADYIMLPIPAGCGIDQGNSAHDGTAAGEGWGVFSGTSAAAPQLAGACALLLEADPSLSPAEVKAILSRTARDVTQGQSSAASNEGSALSAVAGRDSATGTGLVDALAAVMQV